MFYGCSNLKELDISSFDTRNTISFASMFYGANALEKIYVGEKWNTSSNTGETRYVFPDSSNLPNFSNTNPNYRDLSYAHTGEGGYLTLKTN
jgi:surface protein